MSKNPVPKRFLAVPPMRRLLILFAAGALLIDLGYRHLISRMPKEVPPAERKAGLVAVERVIGLVGASEFGRTARGGVLTVRAGKLLRSNRIRFSSSWDGDGLWEKEWFGPGIAFIIVPRGRHGIEWPSDDELARRVYHETLHSVANSKIISKEEECDAFCAAEEAGAAVEKRPPQYPVTRDGERIWEWVATAYPKTGLNPHYQPVCYTSAELASRTGIGYNTVLPQK